MYAIIETGGKQHRVSPGDVIEIERLAAEPGDTVDVDKVLALHDDESLQVGAPLVSNAVVSLEIIEEFRGDKLVVFKMKRRKGLRRRAGHRQNLTRARVTDFVLNGTSLVGDEAAADEPRDEPAEVEAEAAE